MTQQYVFWGGYAGNNLGDEAILWAMSRLIRTLDPTAAQHVFLPDGVTPAVAEVYRRWNIHVVSGPLLRCLDIFRHARLIVGGGQMIDDRSLGWPVGWSSLFLTASHLCGQRPLVLCVGAEALTRPLPRLLVHYAYGLAEIITCRDEESSAAVRATGVSADRVWTTRDVVFSLDRATLPQWTASSSNGSTLAVVVAHDPARVQEDLARYVRLVAGLRALGFTVELVAHDLRPAYDLHALAVVKSSFALDEAVALAQATTTDDVFALYARVDAVISARMHPLIMGTLAGTLPIAFGGKAKVRSLLTISGMPSIEPTGEASALGPQVQAVLGQRQHLLPQLAATVASFRRDVEDTTARALLHRSER